MPILWLRRSRVTVAANIALGRQRRRMPGWRSVEQMVQTVTGNITATRTGGDAGTETVVVNNTSELTFIGDIGTSSAVVDSLTVGSTQANSALKTRGSVYASSIALGSGEAGQNATLTLEADTNDQTVMGAVTGDADDTVTVSVWDRTHGAAADTATFHSALSNIDTLNIGSPSGAHWPVRRCL